MYISRKDYETMRAVIDSLNWTITHKNNEIEKLKAELNRNIRDLHALRVALSGEDIDYPNAKGGNADNTGENEIDFEDF